MSKFFTVVIDSQIDFMLPSGKLYVPEADRCVQPINDYLSSLSSQKCSGVLFTFDTHNPEIYKNSSEAKLFPPHCEVGTTGWNLAIRAAEVSYDIPTFMLQKSVFNMWEEPGLKVETILRSYDREWFFSNVKTSNIQLIGVAADYCVKWAVEGFVKRGFNVLIPNSNLTRGIERQIEQVVEEDFPERVMVV